MIEEAYVSFEVAKLLKEKGFNEKCRGGYHSEFDDNDNSIVMLEKWMAQPYNNDFVDEGFLCSAPTHQMAMAWLREVHNIQIELNWDKGNQLYSFQIWKLGKYQPEISSLDLWRIYKDDNYLGEWNYEDAVEAALKYCLVNLI